MAALLFIFAFLVPCDCCVVDPYGAKGFFCSCDCGIS